MPLGYDYDLLEVRLGAPSTRKLHEQAGTSKTLSVATSANAITIVILREGPARLFIK